MAMTGRFNPDGGVGFRANPGGFGPMGVESRGGHGDEESDIVSSNPPGNPHSSRGFRRALMRTQRSQGTLKDKLADKQHFGGPGFRKPNYFAQGGRRHGMHIGSGAPPVTPAQHEGAEF